MNTNLKVRDMFSDFEKMLPRTRDLFAFDWFDSANKFFTEVTYPKYNLLKKPNGDFIIEIALAGYDKNDIAVELGKQNVLTVKTLFADAVESSNDSELAENAFYMDKDEKPVSDDVQYLHRGIASRGFQITWKLHPLAEVRDVVFENGMLTINIVNTAPKEPEIKRLEIK